MTASDHGVPERREAQRRRIVQPAFYGENRTAVRRTDDVCDDNASEVNGPEAASDVETSGAADAPLPAAAPQDVTTQHDYDFLTGLISMEHSG